MCNTKVVTIGACGLLLLAAAAFALNNVEAQEGQQAVPPPVPQAQPVPAAPLPGGPQPKFVVVPAPAPTRQPGQVIQPEIVPQPVAMPPPAFVQPRPRVTIVID